MKLWRERMAFTICGTTCRRSRRCRERCWHRRVCRKRAMRLVAEFVFHAAGAQTFFGKMNCGAIRRACEEDSMKNAPGKILSWIIRGSAGRGGFANRASGPSANRCFRASAIGLGKSGRSLTFTIRVTEVYRVNSVGFLAEARSPKAEARARSAPPTARVRCRRLFPGTRRTMEVGNKGLQISNK